ncbi:hypothetical protein BpHYR1_033165 [Brachionus plicatilis]|uniref:Uncharacterized protein n=1 Tax=Brachionus plicatilis TaxID=10195 RepID=A0A3M7QL39_BRAPC|nr:hypothetical protein BpHYR1_033165 [Brachionus plicatilis]
MLIVFLIALDRYLLTMRLKNELLNQNLSYDSLEKNFFDFELDHLPICQRANELVGRDQMFAQILINPLNQLATGHTINRYLAKHGFLIAKHGSQKVQLAVTQHLCQPRSILVRIVRKHVNQAHFFSFNQLLEPTLTLIQTQTRLYLKPNQLLHHYKKQWIIGPIFH